MSTLQERARIANIGGDIRLKQQYSAKKRAAEKGLAEYAEEVKGKLSGKYKGEGLVDLLKLASGFIPGVGKAVGTGLSIFDMLMDERERKNMMSKISGLKMDKGNPFYKSYMQPQMDFIMDQAKGAFRGQRKTDVTSGLMGLGRDFFGSDVGKEVKSKLFGKLGKPAQQTVQQYLPFLGFGGDQKTLAGTADEWHPFEELFKPKAYSKPGDVPEDVVKKILAGQRTDEVGPTGLDIFEYLQPRVTEAMRPEREVRVPGIEAGRYRRPNIRGRIT